MHYYSLHNTSLRTSFKEAVINGIAPDKGLYFPESIAPLPEDFIQNISSFSNEEIAFEVIQPFVGDEIPADVLKTIIAKTISFDFPVVPVKNNIATLELFHGPTMAFKDVGAKFMAACLEYFNRDNPDKIIVLVATSGDTGGAVANGFLKVKGIQVVILYPKGRVSEIQEQQLTTQGHNITALEVAGTFDDCQHMVKTAFLDPEIKPVLTSANSINIARWLPQMFYFLFAYKQLQSKNKELVFSVPSGNFGNICAGLMAQQLGLPIKHFIAATNINDTIPLFLKTEKYTPKPSKATLSNAMDVGDPSNFVRILEIFENNIQSLKNTFSSFGFNDIQTKEALKELYGYKYIADPHGAVGYLGLQQYGLSTDETGVFLETAHPIKFLDTVEHTLAIKLDIPEKIQRLLEKEKQVINISSYKGLKEYLNNVE
ncbi:MAG: threonine synthase [Flavobacteriaceae bacterium]|nr:MAG: threonine synthase [Flavobacteriaceae bacterium]